MAAMSCLLGSHMAPGGRCRGRGGGEGLRRRAAAASAAGTLHAAAGRSAPPRPGREADRQRARPRAGGARPAIAGVARGGDAPLPSPLPRPAPPAASRLPWRRAALLRQRLPLGTLTVAGRERGVRRPAWGGGCFALRGLRHRPRFLGARGGTGESGGPERKPVEEHQHLVVKPPPSWVAVEKVKQPCSPSRQVVKHIITPVDRLVSAPGLNK